MTATQNNFQRIAVVAHPQLPEALQEIDEVARFLEEIGMRAVCGTIQDETIRSQIEQGAVDLLIALGGDGTMLRVGHLCAPVNIPILGINMGRFGFLTGINRNEWRKNLLRMKAGDYWVEQRMMLRVEQWRAERLLGAWDVLNEAVVTRSQIVRPVYLTACVDGRLLTTYVADGLIAATATGSTAYALAAGGPILSPELRNILLVPVAPHLSLDRAIVLAEGSSVSITVNTDHQAALSNDGQIPIELENSDRVDVNASDHTVQFLRFQDPGYFYRNLTPHMNQNPSTGNHR